MPRALQSETCRTDTKKNAASSLAVGKRPLLSKASKVLTDKFAKKKSATPNPKMKATKTAAAENRATKVKANRKKGTLAAAPVQRRSGGGVAAKDSNNAESKAAVASKMREKPKTPSTDTKAKKTRAKESVQAKKAVGSAAKSVSGVGKEAKKAKSDTAAAKANVTEKNEGSKSDAHVASADANPALPAKKETKKRKEPNDGADSKEAKKTTKGCKKAEDESAVKKEPPKSAADAAEDGQKKESKGHKPDDMMKWYNEAKKLDERCMAPKKRIKHKCAKESLASNLELERETKVDDKEAADAKADCAPGHEKKSAVRNIKFFKSKSRKLDKSGASPVAPKSSDAYSKEAFAVYDNIDEDSEGPGLSVVKNKAAAVAPKPKAAKAKMQNLRPDPAKNGKAKGKVKSGQEKAQKRKLESDSEVERKIKYKKFRRNVIEDDDSDVESGNEGSKSPTKATKATKKSPAKGKDAKITKTEDDSCSSALSSDNAPLNTLIAAKKNAAALASSSESCKGTAKNVSAKAKRELCSEGSEMETVKSKSKNATKKGVAKNEVVAEKSSKVMARTKKDDSKQSNSESKQSNSESKQSNSDSKAAATKTAPKKSVRFNKSATSKTSVAAKPVRKRRQRMASLNALAMVHCMYENEGKSVSISSFESTENSEDYTVKKEEPLKKIVEEPEEPTNKVEIKTELSDDAVSLVKLEARLEDVAVDPVINRESLRSAPGVRSVGKHWDMNATSISSTVSDDNEALLITNPIVIKEIESVEKPKSALKKKFARALRRHVSEDSSEEDKHQALLLEEKQRMIRRRRRQRKEMTMDLKDMVVCKRMASLNATAILAASYSSTTGKRTITVKSSGKADEKHENEQDFEKTESLLTKLKDRKHPFTKKKFSSSSDADVEDEADISGNEMVVKTASSSGKQQVSLIVNQDSGVTITGLYLNSTTKSTHHQGYCSISGMQYRISSTSHTQTEATTVTTEAIVRTPQEPLRPSVSILWYLII